MKKKSSINNIYIFILINILLSSCQRRDIIKVYYFDYVIEINQARNETIKYFKDLHEELSYEDSYSKNKDGIEMYYFYTDKDSIVSKIELYFYQDILQGINLNASSRILKSDRFIEKMTNEILPKVHGSIDGSKELVFSHSKYNKIDSSSIKQFTYEIDIKTIKFNKFF